MTRTKHDADSKAQHGQEAVKDLPPANPLGEPVKAPEEYPNISEAGKQAAALGVETEETKGTDVPFGETVVEHPVSPTDNNPNPHGTRDTDTGNTVVVSDPNTKVARREAREEGDVEIIGTMDGEPVHLGDGRTLAKGERAKVSKDIANDPNLKGKVKRV